MVAALFAWGWALDFSLIILEILLSHRLLIWGSFFQSALKEKTKTLLGDACSEGAQDKV